jgi:hypothetical protein
MHPHRRRSPIVIAIRWRAAAGRAIPGSAELQYFDADFEEWTAMVGEDELSKHHSHSSRA